MYFKLKNEEHSLIITDITKKRVRFDLYSEPISDDLRISQLKRYDLDRDGTKDIEIFLRGIEGNKATLRIKELVGDSGSANEITGAVVGTDKGSGWAYAVMLAGLIVLIFSLFFWRRSKIN